MVVEMYVVRDPLSQTLYSDALTQAKLSKGVSPPRQVRKHTGGMLSVRWLVSAFLESRKRRLQGQSGDNN
jgi:hypothetical protein